MKIIICGPRDLYITPKYINDKIENIGLNITEVISGGAKGIDDAAINYAIKYNKLLRIFDADWEQFGKAAGPIRNRKMAEYADELLVFKRTKNTPGTSNMIKQMTSINKPVHIVIVED